MLGAVAMVAIAVVVRSALDGGGDDPDVDPGDDEVVLVCDPDLRAACNALGDDVVVRVEDSAATAAALVDGSLTDVDGWVTSAAWLEVARSRTEAVEDAGTVEVLASSEVAVAVDEDRADAVADHCAGASIWRCLGDSAGRPWSDLGGDARWGPLRTGLPDADTAVGLSVAASVAAGFFGDAEFAANDFTELRPWLADLAAPSAAGDRNLLTSLVRVRGTYTAGGLVVADAEGRDELITFTPAPPVAAVAVLVDLPGGDDLAVAGPLREALTAADWDAGGGEPDDLFKPGVLAALHTLWKDTTS